jgi:hypothetical protein
MLYSFFTATIVEDWYSELPMHWRDTVDQWFAGVDRSAGRAGLSQAMRATKSRIAHSVLDISKSIIVSRHTTIKLLKVTKRDVEVILSGSRWLDK